MNTILRLLLITAICVAGMANEAVAQRKRPEKTSSAKAYYGKNPGRPTVRGKKSISEKKLQIQNTKRVKAEARNRRKSTRA